MGKDYFKVLGVSKDADADQLKKAYHKLAAKFHPDKVRGDEKAKADASEKFKEIGEAYDVLSDPQKRQVYEAYGEEGLKGGVPPSGFSQANGMPGGGGFSSQPYNFDSSAAQRLFEQLFGGMGGMGGGMGSGGARMFSTGNHPGGAAFQFFSTGGSPGGSDDELHQPPGFSPGASPGFQGFNMGSGDPFGMGGGRRGMHQDHGGSRQHEVELPLSLEQLYTGVKKKLRVTRQLLDAASGKPVPVQEVLELEVRPGWKSGTRVTFEGKGDELPGRPAQDLVFVIAEQPHSQFKRHGNDLAVTVQIPLVTALTGGNVQLRHLDGHAVTLPLKDVVTPGSERVIQGEGMPVSKTPGARGNLHVKLEVDFPRRLTDQQKQAIRAALA